MFLLLLIYYGVYREILNILNSPNYQVMKSTNFHTTQALLNFLIVQFLVVMLVNDLCINRALVNVLTLKEENISR
jgi:hypothetical protein